jgi:hypothetical protein
VWPAVAANDLGDAAVAWVDASTREVMVSTRVAGGSYGPPTAVSPQESTSDAPAVTIDPAGTVTVAWHADQPYGYQPSAAPNPPGLVMAATASRGGAFSAPRAALTGPSGAVVNDLEVQSDSAGRVVVDAVISNPAPTWNNPGGTPPQVTYATATGDGPFSAQQELGTDRGGFSPTWTLASDGGLLEAHPDLTSGQIGIGQLITNQVDANGSITTETPYQIPPGVLAGVNRVAGGLDSTGDRTVVFTTGETLAPGNFGNPASGSILSVIKFAGSSSWCQAQLISGLMSPYFPISVAFDGHGRGIAAYQQNPWGDIAVSYLVPHAGCPPPAAQIPVALAPSARTDPKLHTATVASLCTTTSGCRGRLILLDSSRRTLASGSFSAANRSMSTIHLRITPQGRNALRHHNYIRATVRLLSGRRSQSLAQITLARG